MTPQNSWFVYMVQCADGTLYTGITTDVERRVTEHNSAGKVGAKYTRTRQPVCLVYVEAASTRSDASKREHCIKRMDRIKKQRLIHSVSRNPSYWTTLLAD